jgi:hypothetical protein
MEFIQGEKFIGLSNNKNIFYSHTHEVPNLLRNPPSESFILITHNSDHKITEGLLNFMPKNLIKWYAQNVCVKNDRIISIPIGLENSEWFPDIQKIDKIKKKIDESKNIKNLLYINHDIKTNVNERLKPYKLFFNKPFVKCFRGSNGSNFDMYLDDIYNHKFVLCPEGNGTDTHRIWECLYLNTIPIEKRNINNSFYNDLPICFVDDWDDISEDFLNKEYERIKNTEYDMSKIDFKYWKQKIVNSI